MEQIKLISLLFNSSCRKLYFRIYLVIPPFYLARYGDGNGIDVENEKPKKSVMLKGMFYMVIGVFSSLMCFPIIWLPGHLCRRLKSMSPFCQRNQWLQFFTWLGLLFPCWFSAQLLGKKIMDVVPLSNTGYHLLSLVIMALILAFMPVWQKIKSNGQKE